MKTPKRYVLIASVFIIIVFIMFIGLEVCRSDEKTPTVTDDIKDVKTSYDDLVFQDYFIQPESNWGLYKEKIEVKGIFITGNTLTSSSKFERLLNLVNETELNSMVIDVKDDKGILTYISEVNIAEEIGANSNVKVKDFDEKIELIRENNIYTIARIVTFKDRLAGSRRPDLAIKTKDGGVWRDNKGNTWLNPFNREAWEYPIQLAEEAALKGFKEIQFDYVRFPTDGDMSNIDYGQAASEMTKAEAIAQFLSYARERLEPKGVYVSADIFGDIINVKGDSGIGQNLEALAVSTDILCPMIYPSHYALGSYGVPYPDSNPYKIIYEALIRAKKRIDNIENVSDDKKAILRPWLQDFSAPWLKRDYGEYWISYGPNEIKAQIQATHDAGIKEWIFWNSSNNYTEQGYRKESNNENN